MSDPQRWTVIETELLQDCQVFRVSRMRSRSHDGRHHPFYRIDSSEWVNVVPVTPSGDVVMIRQYRHGAGEITLETPGGLVDPGETSAEAAARELLEETGYRAAEMVALGGVNPNPALFGNRLHGFLARGAERVAEVDNGQNEETVVQVVPRAELRELIRAGTIDHALVIAVLFLLELFESQEKAG